jgi:thymidine kinase
MAKLYFRYSAMNAGKSTAMLQVAHNYEERDMQIALFTAAIDDRHSVGTVASRLGVTRQAEIFSAATDFSQLFSHRKVACILIDEAQFLSPEQVKQLHILAHQNNLPVICYGLRADFLGMPFPGSAYLLALADDLEEMKTICLCGKKATMNARINEQGFRETSGTQILIGGNSRYLAMCAKCYYAAKIT